jgi:Glycosyltransferase family 87
MGLIGLAAKRVVVLLAVLRAISLTVLVVGSLTMPALFISAPMLTDDSGGVVDFRTFWHAARVFASHGNPYPADPAAITWSLNGQETFVYPAPIAGLLAPFAAIPYAVAAPLFSLLLFAAVVGSLWLFEVRDWRCYAAVSLWPATLMGVGIGALSPLLLLGVAACWRFRDRARVAGACLAVVVLAKLFLWPLAIWFWFTGRRQAAIYAAAIGAALTVLGWAWIGFDGLTSYPALVSKIGSLAAPHGYAPAWFFGGQAGIAIATLLGVPALILAARRRSNTESFALATLIALLLTPILWMHYLVLVGVLAVVRPRFGVVWIAPVALWFTPHGQAGGHLSRVLIVVTIISAIVAKLAVEGANERRVWMAAPPDGAVLAD